jgi:hypothetical protein
MMDNPSSTGLGGLTVEPNRSLGLANGPHDDHDGIGVLALGNYDPALLAQLFVDFAACVYSPA